MSRTRTCAADRIEGEGGDERHEQQHRDERPRPGTGVNGRPEPDEQGEQDQPATEAVDDSGDYIRQREDLAREVHAWHELTRG